MTVTYIYILISIYFEVCWFSGHTCSAYFLVVTWKNMMQEWRIYSLPQEIASGGASAAGLQAVVLRVFGFEENSEKPRCNMVQYGAIWYNMVQYGAIWCNMVQYGAIWCNMVQYTRSARDRSIPRSLQRSVSTKSPISHLTFFLFIIKSALQTLCLNWSALLL